MSLRPYNNKDKICPPHKDIFISPFIKCALARDTPSFGYHVPSYSLSINYTLGGHYRVLENLNKSLQSSLCPPSNIRQYPTQRDDRTGEEKDEAFYLAVEEGQNLLPRQPRKRRNRCRGFLTQLNLLTEKKKKDSGLVEAG
ncbi:4446_t:CDS:1 [Paraglomus brasilianum]|uniref:4446_t:CDS:1 n=1 Tax=Paraglomus brasilianum TaxID=144538 RepID=A0A9N9GZH4_9GLOM|nr:4446_t:CDS:1 [Paraglomus brasilianum]